MSTSAFDLAVLMVVIQLHVIPNTIWVCLWVVYLRIIGKQTHGSTLKPEVGQCKPILTEHQKLIEMSKYLSGENKNGKRHRFRHATRARFGLLCRKYQMSCSDS